MIINGVSFIGSWGLAGTANIAFTNDPAYYQAPIVQSNAEPTITYSISPASGSVNEGSTVALNVTTTNLGSGTLYWTINNVSTSNADFSAYNGSVSIAGDSGSFTVGPIADYATEGAETFTVQLRTGSTSGTVVATSSSITVNDTSVANVIATTYAITSNVSTVSEGNVVLFTVATANVASNTTLYWTINNVSTSNADFLSNVVTGSFTISANTGTYSVTANADYLTEGSETFTVQLRTGSTSGTVVATSNTITISDTSLSNANVIATTYAVTSNVSTVSEGNVVLFTVTTANVASNTTLYWTVNNISTSNVDFVSNTVSGSFTISANTGTYSVTAKTDYLTEGSETFTTQVRTVSTSGTVVATSNTITISDTSLSNATPTTFTFQNVGFNYTVDGLTGNFPNIAVVRGGTYYFDLSNVTSSHPLALRYDSGDTTAVPGTTGNNPTSGAYGTTLTYLVPNTAPNSIVYRCVYHAGMIGYIYISG